MVAALYPFILLLLTYILVQLHARDCKPVVAMWKLSKCSKFHSSWNSRSLIQVFATLFFLAFIKFVGVLVDLMFSTNVINMDNKVVATVSYIDPSIALFSSKHLSIIFLLSMIFISFLLPLVFLLILSHLISYYLLQKVQFMSEIKMASCYKDIHRHISWQFQRWHRWDKGLQTNSWFNLAHVDGNASSNNNM